MSLVAEKGIFTCNTGTGNQTVNLGSAFNGIIPKAVILWTSDRTSVGAARADARFSLGWGTYRGSAVVQGYVGYFSDDTPTASDVLRACSANSILRGWSASAPTLDYELDLVSLNSGTPSTFVVNVVDAPAAAILVHYIALGGTDITDALAGAFTYTTTTPQSVAMTAGFGQPDLLFFLNQGGFAASDGTAGTGGLALGVAASDTVRQSCVFTETDASANMAVNFWQKQRALVQANPAAFAEMDLDAKASWPTDGFQVTWPDIGDATSRTVQFLALKGTFQTQMGVNAAPIAGGLPVSQDNSAGFVPKLGMIFGGNQPASATLRTADADANSLLGTFGIGATDGTNEGYASMMQDDALATSQTSTTHTNAKVWQNHHPDATPTLTSEADGSFSGNNLNLSWNDIDAGAKEYIWLALGDAPAAATPSLIWDPSTTSTIYTR